jgi:exonuclease III
MKILAWNCRGLGKPHAVRALQQLLKVHSPDMVFLSETKLCESDPNLKSKLCFNILPNYLLVNCGKQNGKRSGGLAMIWKSDVNLTILDHNERYIDCYINCPSNNISWYATGFYGFSTHNEKHKSCDIINNIRSTHQHDNWLIFGDFNMIINADEKLGGNQMDTNISDLFHNTLNACNLIDLGYIGDKFTWANNQASNHHIQERLDGFLATHTWIANYPNFKNNHLLRYASDHCPILLEFWSNSNCRKPKKRSQITRFEQLWLQDEESNLIVKHMWQSSTEITTNKLSATLNHLHKWGIDKYGNIPRKIKKLQQDIHHLKGTIPDAIMLQKTKVLERELDELMKEDELWWAQRAKSNWLKTGDKNSRFFHIKAS